MHNFKMSQTMGSHRCADGLLAVFGVRREPLGVRRELVRISWEPFGVRRELARISWASVGSRQVSVGNSLGSPACP